MGVFKDMRDLRNMGKQMRQNMPSPAETMATAQARMARAQAILAGQQAAAAMNAAGTGVRRTVTVTAIRHVGSLSFSPLVEFDVTVLPEGKPPYPATVQQAVSPAQVGQLRPGMTLQASVDPSNPESIWLDLSSIA
jgi:hypothetical protein